MKEFGLYPVYIACSMWYTEYIACSLHVVMQTPIPRPEMWQVSGREKPGPAFLTSGCSGPWALKANGCIFEGTWRLCRVGSFSCRLCLSETTGIKLSLMVDFTCQPDWAMRD